MNYYYMYPFPQVFVIMPPVEDDVQTTQASEATAFSPPNFYNSPMDGNGDDAEYKNNSNGQIAESNLPNERISEEDASISRLGQEPETSVDESSESRLPKVEAMSLGVSGANQESSQVVNRNPDETPSTSNIPGAASHPETSQPCNTSLSTSTPPLSSSYGTTTEPLIHHPSPFDHSSESDNSHTTSSSSSSSDSDESESDMFGPPRNHSVTSPPPRSKTRVPMISARLRLKEERRRVIRLCGEKLERIRDPDSDLRRSVCINNTYYRLQVHISDLLFLLIIINQNFKFQTC